MPNFIPQPHIEFLCPHCGARWDHLTPGAILAHFKAYHPAELDHDLDVMELERMFRLC